MSFDDGQGPVIVFLRHGDYHQRPDTPSAHQPYPLTAKGRQQAEAAAGRLIEMATRRGWQWQREIHSSPLLRAWETAEVVQRDLSLGGSPLVISQADQLMERGLGAGANLTLAELEAVIAGDPRHGGLPADWKSDSAFRLPLPGAESLLVAGRRVANYVRSVLDGLDGSQEGDPVPAVLFVGHGAAFRHAAFHLGALARDDLPRLSMFHARPVALQANASGSWRTVAGEWKVRETKSTHTLD